VPKLPDPADPATTSSNRNSILAARESARWRPSRPPSLRDCSSSSSGAGASSSSSKSSWRVHFTWPLWQRPQHKP
jgi:hypothetical protein